jgi:hypothetical protein
LTITDLPCADTLHRDAMSMIRGGIMTMTKPDSGIALPGIPPSLPMSWPGAEFLKDLHIPTSTALSPARPPQDPRLL